MVVLIAVGWLLAVAPLEKGGYEDIWDGHNRSFSANHARPFVITERRKPMPAADLNIMRTSRDPKALSAHARLLAQSVSENDHVELKRYLQSNEFLNRLDTQEQYQGPPRKLRVWEVLRELRENDTPPARKLLVELTQSREFTQEPSRVDLLIQATDLVRPAPTTLIEFWDRYSQPDDGYSHLTIDTVVANGSEPAMKLLEKKMLDPAHSVEDKTAWAVSSILIHRNDLLLLQTCDRLLKGGLSEELRPVLLEALFDYRPTEWYSPATLLMPPDRKNAAPEALLQLRETGRMALNSIRLTHKQERAVKKTLDEVERLLEEGENLPR